MNVFNQKLKQLLVNKFSHILMAIALVAASALTTACNSDSDYEYEPLDYSAVSVTGFSLKSNKAVLNNLDSVFFSINLNTAEIYNADSLPYGTNVSRLGITISTSACSAATLHVPQGTGKDDKVYDYLTQGDSLIDFSHGAVRFNIVSADGTKNRDYYIKVNVHTVVPDSLYWSELARTDLPTSFRTVKAQKSVSFKGQPWCLTTDGSAYAMAVGKDVFEARWDVTPVTFGRQVDVRSFTATESALYILGTDGTLLTSTDGFSWSSTGESWTTITGAYGDRLLGVKRTGASFNFVELPGGVKGAVPAGFPVSGASAPVSFDSKWSEAPQIIIAGGVTADGSLIGDTWCYAGDRWAKLSSGLPAAEGYAAANVTICETDTVSWRVKESAVTLLFGGRNAEGINNTVYLSRDLGVTWKKGDDLVQLPEYLVCGYDCDVLVFDHMLTPESFAPASVAKRWESMQLAPLATLPGVASRAVAPIESWECPFLYMFGGVGANGAVQPYVWRGVVNHFTFIPLQ